MLRRMDRRGWALRACLAAAVAVAVLQLPGVGGATGDELCRNIDPQTVRCRIPKPAVTQRMTEYPAIAFQAGDAVQVGAGGCVNIGSSGLSWRRYVDPTGTDASRFYAGTIWIPGVTSGLVRIAGIQGGTFEIPSGIDPAPSFLRP